MYRNVEGSRKETVQGIACFIPPVPDETEIAGHNLPKKEQKWTRTELPTFKVSDIDWFSGDEPEDPFEEIEWDTARREETIKQTGRDPWDLDGSGNAKLVKGVEKIPDYVCESLQRFRNQELDRVFNGYWFYNNGEATYITGAYYFFLNWWKLDVGYPKYRNPDRQLYNIMEVVYEDPRAFGLIYITMRGVGKSVQAGSMAYYQTITHEKSHVGLQSKSDDDAAELFSGKISEPLKDLPDFLIPINRHGTNPTSGLDFSPPSKTGKSASLHRETQKKALRSKLTFRNAGDKAFDGETLKFTVQDEIGKVEAKVGNVHNRWLVIRQCLFRDGVKRGWGLLTTTVEEMDKGGEPCKQIWYESDQMERNKNGRTVSWAYRYFRSALDAGHFDEYGFPDREKNRAFHDAEREAITDPVSQISYMQKNPYTIEEAFMTQGETCVYNAAILHDRQITLSNPVHPTQFVIKGDFSWERDEEGVPIRDSKVEFIRNDVNGKWDVSFINIPEKEMNQLVAQGEIEDVMQWRVNKTGRRVIGYDPYSAKKTVYKNKQSDAGAAVYQRFDQHIPEEFTETIIADYAGREHDPSITHEQIIMASVFFGAEVLVESNKLGAIDYINMRGYSDILMERPSSTGTKDDYHGIQGMPSNQNTITYYVELTGSHIVDNGYKLKHLRIVQDWLDFDPQNTTKYDSAVGASLSVVASKKPREDFQESEDVSYFFDTFKHQTRKKN